MTTICGSALRDFLALSYAELTDRNLEMKRLREQGKSNDFFQKKIMKYLQDEKRLKAITVAFCDLEGRLHMLDYDKDFFLSSYDNLTFDGSSIGGFSKLAQSDLRFDIDWGSFRWLPADVFGSGKVLLFAFVANQDGSPYHSDFRSRLKDLAAELMKKHGYTVYVSPEIEGFLLEGADAEQNFHSCDGFQLVTRGGYFSALPQDRLRRFVDTVAEVQRAMGFENEKDHPEVAPSTFEINFKYTDVVTTCDHILLYKLIARQVAKLMDCTACFLSKPVVGINGSGMHSNISIGKGSKNLFYQKKKTGNLSEIAEKFANGIMYYANDLCLTIVPSINSYRALDPNFEAPNEIKMSATNRGAMIRIPIGNERSSRIEVRSVRPDANPYLAYFSLIHAGLKGVSFSQKEYKEVLKTTRKKRFLWTNIYDAIAGFKASRLMKEIMGEEEHQKYYELKQEAAHRSPREMGSKIKTSEIIFHHEVRNQQLWNEF